MADPKKFIERLFEVVHERIDHAEQIGLQKLDEIEQKGRREVERASSRHDKKVRKLEKERQREARRSSRRRSHSRSSSRNRSNDEFEAQPVPPTPPTPPAPGFHSHPHPLPGREHRHRRHRRSHAKKSAEERAYARARRRANLRLAFYTHAAAYGAVLFLLVMTTRSARVVGIVGLFWGLGLFMHYFWTLVAPRLRERWIQREVGEIAPQDVSRERVRTEGRHNRNMEDLSASIAHEIRNPIAAAKSLVQQMGEDPTTHDNIEFASVALNELDRVERSISHLLRYAREEDLRIVPMQMSDVVHSAVETFRDRLQRSQVELQLQIDTPGGMRGDAEQLRRVLINLVANALDALDEAGTHEPVLQVMSGDNLAGDEVWVRVQDNGPGIDDDTRAKIWSPFYTTKESGTGLGLALSRKIVDAHGGDMELNSRPGEGTEFVLTFPKKAPANQRREERGHAI